MMNMGTTDIIIKRVYIAAKSKEIVQSNEKTESVEDPTCWEPYVYYDMISGQSSSRV